MFVLIHCQWKFRKTVEYHFWGTKSAFPGKAGSGGDDRRVGIGDRKSMQAWEKPGPDTPKRSKKMPTAWQKLRLGFQSDQSKSE